MEAPYRFARNNEMQCNITFKKSKEIRKIWLFSRGKREERA